MAIKRSLYYGLRIYNANNFQTCISHTKKIKLHKLGIMTLFYFLFPYYLFDRSYIK